MASIKVTDWRELQGLIAFKILEHFYEKGDSKHKKALQQGLANNFHGQHGSEEPVSYASLAFDGQKAFQRLYDPVEGAVGNGGHILCLSLMQDAGLSLWNWAEVIIGKCKNAIAFLKEKMKPDGLFYSGLNADDIFIHVLDKMNEYLKIDQTNEVVDDNDKNDGDYNYGVDPAVRLSSWYFCCGSSPIQLFGPFPPLEEQCALFNLSSLDALSVGRKMIHSNNAKNKRTAAPLTGVDTNAAMLPSGFKLGIDMKEKTAIVHLAQQQMMATTRNDKLKFEMMSKTIDVLKDELNFALAIVRELQIMDKEDDAWKNVFDLQKKLAETNRAERIPDKEEAKERGGKKRNGSIFDTFISS